MTARRASASGGFASRRALKSAHQIRSDWVRAISGVTSTPIRFIEEAGDGERWRLAMIVALRDLSQDNFPLQSWSARTMAFVFLHLARGFVHPDMGPEARTAFAPVLTQAGTALDDMLTAFRDSESRAWRGQTGEREE